MKLKKKGGKNRKNIRRTKILFFKNKSKKHLDRVGDRVAT